MHVVGQTEHSTFLFDIYGSPTFTCTYSLHRKIVKLLWIYGYPNIRTTTQYCRGKRPRVSLTPSTWDQPRYRIVIVVHKKLTVLFKSAARLRFNGNYRSEQGLNFISRDWKQKIGTRACAFCFIMFIANITQTNIWTSLWTHAWLAKSLIRSTYPTTYFLFSSPTIPVSRPWCILSYFNEHSNNSNLVPIRIKVYKHASERTTQLPNVSSLCIAAIIAPWPHCKICRIGICRSRACSILEDTSYK